MIFAEVWDLRFLMPSCLFMTINNFQFTTVFIRFIL